MKRSLVVTGLSILGTTWLLAYKTAPPTLGVFNPVPSPSPLASPSASPSTSPIATPNPSPKSSPSPSPSPTPLPTPTGVSGTFTGSDVTNRFGDVQVKVSISNGHITDIQAIHYPTDRAESAYISSVVVPMLHDEVIQAQSANINIISGATYTSQSYAQSLSSALQQAHMG